MTTAASRYSALEAAREPFLRRAREAAKLTIPSLMPPMGHTGTTKLYTPYQGIGARGVNNLAAKLILALLPPNSPFFRLQIDDFTLERMTQRPGMRGEVEKALNKVERSVMTEIETTALRVPAGEGIKHLVVAGNALLYMLPGRGMRMFSLDRYVVNRDPAGNILEIITKESVAPGALPLEVQAALPKNDQVKKSDSPEKSVDLYTYVKRFDNRWTVFQEIKGTVVPGSRGWYPLDKSPWIALRWSHIDGESYGRGHVEEYIGDLRSLEALMKAMVEGAAAAAKVLFLVNPNGTTNQKILSEAPNGAVRPGQKDDVTVLQLDKFADFQVAFKVSEMIEQRLSMAFMLNSSIQRNGERVTAEEIRYMAGELEDALGGVYSILSQEFQLPFVSRLLFQMEKAKTLPPLPKEVRPAITTGLEAIGRGHDVQKLDQLMAGIGQMFGPQALAANVDVAEYIKRRGTALGIDMDGLILTEEQKAAAQQQQMMQTAMERLGPKGMDIVRDQMKPQTGAPNEQAQAA